MKILMVLEVDFPPDDRVEKEAISLIEEGHEVDIACYTTSGKLSVEVYKGIRIIRKPITRFILKSSAACLIVPFYFHFWKKFLTELLKKEAYATVHVHDLPLSKVVYNLAREYNLKVVFDQHEYYSNWIVHTAHMQKGLGKFVNFLSNWRSYEKKYLPKADLVITVEEPLRQEYITKAGIDPVKIINAPNTPLEKVFNRNNVHLEIAEKYNGQYILFYAGGLDRLRGLEIPIKALQQLKSKIPNLKLILAGKLSKGFDLFDLAEKLDVTDVIEYHSWIESNLIPSYLAVTKIGFFTPPGNRDEIHNTIATKIYQYLAMNVPVIVSNVRLMKQFIEEHGIGYVVNNESDFAEIVLDLYNHPDKREELVNNSKKYNKTFTWEKTIRILLEKYTQLQ